MKAIERKKCIDETDPFHAILFNKNSDFLENDHFYMDILTTQLMNMILGLLVTWQLTIPESRGNEDGFNFHFFHNYINRTTEVLAFLQWVWLLWKGTKDEIFFSRSNAIHLLISSILVLSAHIYGVVKLVQLETGRKT
jgi:hypothetical protein